MRAVAKPWLFVFVAILGFFTLQTAFLMLGLDDWYTRRPYWDQGAHALDAIHFSLALRTFSLGSFLVQLNESGMWPPVIPLLQAPFLVAFGESVANVRNWIAFSSVPTILMVFAVGVQSHRRFGILVGAVAAALLAVSPGYLEFCMQEMYEIPGIMLSMLCLFFYLRFVSQQNVRDWRLTCLTGILLFFAKFNYAILIMLPIVVAEFFARADFRAALRLASLTFLRDVRWRSPFTIFILLYVLFLLYASKVGVHFDLMGRHVSIERALGNPTYFLVLLLLGRNLIFNRPLLKRYGKAIWQADEPVRSLLRLDVLPAFLWLSYPTFFSTFFIFLLSEKTRKNSFFSLETLTFYPGALLKLFTPHPAIGAAVLGSLVLSLLMWTKLPRASRFILGLSLFNFALTLTHPNYQERYLLSTVPLLLLNFGLTLAHIAEWLLPQEKGLSDHGVRFAAAGIAIAVLSAFAPKKEFLQQSFTYNTQDPAIGAAFAAICDEAWQSERNTVIGFSGTIAPSSIALECYQRHPGMRRSQLPVTMTRHGFYGETSAEKIISSHKIDQFFVIDSSQLGRSVGRLQEANLLPDATKALPLATEYLEKMILDQGPGGFRILAYRLKPGSTPAIGRL